MATIYRTLLAKGYFPKELPPTFFTEHFAAYVTSRAGRAHVATFKPPGSLTECVDYELALPGGDRRRLALPHPGSFAFLSQLVAKDFPRLLKRAAGSKCARSRPVYSADGARALRPSTRPPNLARERAIVRGGARYLLKLDVSQFYPSLYTHAVGWAIDPKLRQRANWQDHKLLGKRVDQALMDWQGKISQGIPIGNDISYLLAEIVLAEVDRSLKVPHATAVRWFDDYEIACGSLEEAERWLARMQAGLARFRLKLNPAKTKIVPLPDPALDSWQAELVQATRKAFNREADMIAFFDVAFRLRAQHPGAPVLNYALGLLFRLRAPMDFVAKVAQSSITQAILAEPGAAQKALALLTFWELNGSPFDRRLLQLTVRQMVLQQRHRGLSSDVSWGLFFCVQHGLSLPKAVGDALASCGDNCISLQALHLRDEGLLPKTFKSRTLARAAKQGDLHGPDWLLLYEADRQGFPGASGASASHPFFADLLKKQVAFYRRKVPSYAAVIHPGGAPEWVVARWLKDLRAEPQPPSATPTPPSVAPIVATIATDVNRISEPALTTDQLIARLLDIASGDRPTLAEEADAGIEYL